MRPIDHLARHRSADRGADPPDAGTDRSSVRGRDRSTPVQLRAGAERVLIRVSGLDRQVRDGHGVRIDAIESITGALRTLQDAIEVAGGRRPVLAADLVELRHARQALAQAMRVTLDLLGRMERR